MHRTGTVLIGSALGFALLQDIAPVAFQALALGALVAGCALVAASKPCTCDHADLFEPAPEHDEPTTQMHVLHDVDPETHAVQLAALSRRLDARYAEARRAAGS